MEQANVKQQYATHASSKNIAIPGGIDRGIEFGKVTERAKTSAKHMSLTKYEVTTIVMAFILCACLLVLRMYVHGHHLEIQQAIEEHTIQMHNVQTQTAIMETEINMKRNYETIQQAARDNGMTINRANIKEVSNDAGN
ncbi:hypothetical protein NHG25_06970 [Aerococcaceae bacterium NML191292]|nr:hypothetical protein [Aerococcaceae bacterium NML210727]MCW6654238.1 hypothetical protein [Aerococcaceae bacterium NML201296]MCW6660220.1 hypothetical protein [Aerococcaceae bacterium NML191292]MCW6661011.1 hypothetical protein [Aerococcaceae bacterium NML201209]MCW6663598.1 hypothetical protein [Aerococcaceae bacterium NML190073]MCW6664069.1 hypothetical protein [Aerococcaceae bacterium NML191219]MCW6667022.1 hypothetical protein [Aerococcaceae bacterium NML190938]